MRLLLSIPSPSSNGISIGSFTLRMYGVMIALGVVAAVWLARVRWRARGGDAEDITTIALFAVPAGLIGARLYHVITDNQLYRGHWIDAFKVWDGGLGIPGGILAGVVVGVLVGRSKGIQLGTGLDAVAPALPLAQAIGRWGNWWNQELFGRPTDLPWGLEIDRVHRPAEFASAATFQPTFLYESLWNLALCGVLILIDRKRALRPGRIMVLYVGGYFLGRLWVEALRSDTANTILGLRVNTWISLLAIVGAVLFLLIGGVRRRPGDEDRPYTDGHRFDPVTAELIPGPSAGGAADAGDDGPTDDQSMSADVATSTGGPSAAADESGRSDDDP